MNNVHLRTCAFNFEEVFELLFSLESLIKITQDACIYKEMTSIYYNLPDKQTNLLSEERNHYINMLNLALEKTLRLKEVNTTLEKEFITLK